MIYRMIGTAFLNVKAAEL